jgi:hypothetical protein
MSHHPLPLPILINGAIIRVYNNETKKETLILPEDFDEKIHTKGRSPNIQKMKYEKRGSTFGVISPNGEILISKNKNFSVKTMDYQNLCLIIHSFLLFS